MKKLSATFRRFLTAEEIPRWFGLAIVLIYLVGLGSVAHYGVKQTRREGLAYFTSSSQYAARLLAYRLGALDAQGLSETALETAYQRALGEFAGMIPVRTARVVDDRQRIVASLDPSEVGQTRPDNGIGGSVSLPFQATPIPVAGQDEPDQFLRVRISRQPTRDSRLPRTDPQHGDDHSDEDGLEGATPVLAIEMRLPPEPRGSTGPAEHARTLAVVLAVLGALFVVYRCLREQLRSVSRIAARLKSHQDRLEDELDTLRLVDTADSVGTAWNQLIDVIQRLRETVQRSDADQELTQALQRSGSGALADALNVIPDALLYVKDEGCFEYANAAMSRLLGWEADQAKRTTLQDAEATGVGVTVLEVLRRSQRPDGTFDTDAQDFEATDASGNPSSYRILVTPLQRAGSACECIVFVRDISQQTRADRAREEFITQVTHELRTPLTNIRAYTETLSSGMFDDPTVITECYNVITKETRRLSRLIEDILSVSQLEVGSIELQMNQVDLEALLNESVRDVRGLADDKKIDLQLALPSKLEPIQADRDKLAVVVNNLLANAIKYTPSGGNVVVGCQFSHDEAKITFKDNGIGIDPKEHARVFEKFQRAEDPDVQNETGTGIGLYTAREIVRRHHGEMELMSAKGQGSTFVVRLPHRETRTASLSLAEEVS